MGGGLTARRTTGRRGRGPFKKQSKRHSGTFKDLPEKKFVPR